MYNNKLTNTKDCSAQLKRILWIGTFQSEKQFTSMTYPNMAQASAYTSQKGLIKGIDSTLPADTVLDTINLVPYPPYPIHPNKKIQTEIWSRNHSSYDCQVGFRNTIFFNYFNREMQVYKRVKQWAAKFNQRDSVVFVYAPNAGKLKAALYLKKNYGFRVYVIVPDIPEHSRQTAPAWVRLLKQIARVIITNDFKAVDGFILYSRHMADYYRFTPERWLLMEGVFDENELKYFNAKPANTNKHTIMLCGALSAMRNIPLLLEAFYRLENKSCELLLVGKGDCEKLIAEYANKDPRIKYLGFISDRAKILSLESSASVLVHLWNLTKSGATYGFPSKMFEYLASGATVLAPKMPAISDEWFNYISEIKEVTVEGIKTAIEQALSMPEAQRRLNKIRARNFILNNKTSAVQAAKILKFARII